MGHIATLTDAAGKFSLLSIFKLFLGRDVGLLEPAFF